MVSDVLADCEQLVGESTLGQGMDDSLLCSSLCTEQSLVDSRMLAWADRIRDAWDHSHTGAPVLTHRKIWEWVFIIQALYERGMLGPGRRGIGFGVGQDPLAALFASLGCEVVATDLEPTKAAEAGWVESEQHAATLADLNRDGICDAELFSTNVSFRFVDMRAIPQDLRRGGFDFSWSACSFEHLGSIWAGEEFVFRQMDCLRPGGTAVHTTEFNVQSNSKTVRVGHTVLFRRRDVESLVKELRLRGHAIEVDFDTGSSPADLHVDQPPWSGPHLKIQLERFVATSIGLIVGKAADPNAESWRPSIGWMLRRRWSETVATLDSAPRHLARHVRGRLRR